MMCDTSSPAPQVMAKMQGLDWRGIRRLVDIQRALEVSLPGMEQTVMEMLHPEPYSKQEVCELLGVTEEELNKESLSPNTIHGN